MAYDRAMAATEAAGLGERRRALLAEAHGDVVEIGAGTGRQPRPLSGRASDRLVLRRAGGRRWPAACVQRRPPAAAPPRW